MKQAMLSALRQRGLAQADLNSIGRSRGFDAETAASRVLLQHAFLSSQGLSEAMASLTETEILGLHLLHHRGEAVGLEYFQRIYPDPAAKDRYGTPPLSLARPTLAAIATMCSARKTLAGTPS